MKPKSPFRHILRAAISLVALSLLTLTLLWHLGDRPVHADEANQMVKTDALATSGIYHYDPTDHHGPLLYYITAPIVKALTKGDINQSEAWMYRIIPVGFIWLSVLLIFGLGTWRYNGTFRSHRSSFLAALFLLTSPLICYYSTYYIQEVMLAFFLLAMGVAIRYYAYWPSWRSALAFGAAAAGALCSKETALVAFGAMLIAGWWSFGVHRIVAYWRTRHVLISLLTFLALSALVLTDFLRHPMGFVETFSTMIGCYSAKAFRDPSHLHPWYYYLQLLFCYPQIPGQFWREGLMMIPALYAIGVSFKTGKSRAIRFIAIYTLVLTLFYTLIPYKTPWCSVTFWVPWLLLAGAGVGMLWERMGHWKCHYLWRGILALIAAMLVINQWQLRDLLTGKLSADTRNPWAYAHTSHDAVNLTQAILNQSTPEDIIAVALPAEDTWPLPWYLRTRKVGYWQKAEEVTIPTPRLLLLPEGDSLPSRYPQPTRCKSYRIRPGVTVHLYSFAQ